jgi:hypothetical protein
VKAAVHGDALGNRDAAWSTTPRPRLSMFASPSSGSNEQAAMVPPGRDFLRSPEITESGSRIRVIMTKLPNIRISGHEFAVTPNKGHIHPQSTRDGEGRALSRGMGGDGRATPIRCPIMDCASW